jgi:hypothetical protein
MKTTILTVFSGLMITLTLAGQTNKSKYQFKEMKADTALSNSISDYSQTSVNKKTDLFSKKKSDQNFNLGQKRYPPDRKINRPHADSLLAEEYPGSSRYYAKWPFKTPPTYEKSFIIKPDTSVKYYLIIKDPINHTVTK